MSFASPLALLALLLVPAAAIAYVWFQRRRVRDSARFVEPGLMPNIVDRVPGWRRHLPVLLLLLAVTGFLVGFARPHATISVRSEEATAILAIDTSRSMGATDLSPTRLAVAQASARRFLADLPEKYRVSVVAFSSVAQVVSPPTRDREFVDSALGTLRIGEGTALGDAVATGVGVATGKPQSGNASRGRAARARSDPRPLGRRRRRWPDRAHRGHPARPAGEGARVHGVARHRGGRRAGAACGRLCREDPGPSRPRRASPGRDADGRPLLRSADGGRSQPRIRRPQVAARQHRQGRGDHRRLRAGSILLLLAGGALSALWFRRVP